MLTALLAVALVAGPTPPPSARHISISGDARLPFHPNRAQVTLSVTASHRDQAVATKLGEEKVRKVLEACTKAGLQPADFVPNASGPSPEYRGSEVIGYNVVRTLSLTVGDLSKADGILTAALRAGALPYGAVTLSHTDQRGLETKARLAAAKAARERAVGMVEALGGHLGLPVSLTETAPRLEYASVRPLVAGQDGAVTTGYADVEMAVIAQVLVQFDIEAP